jgi:hypothetical protein
MCTVPGGKEAGQQQDKRDKREERGEMLKKEGKKVSLKKGKREEGRGLQRGKRKGNKWEGCCHHCHVFSVVLLCKRGHLFQWYCECQFLVVDHLGMYRGDGVDRIWVLFVHLYNNACI